jgi:hypothetical protein
MQQANETTLSHISGSIWNALHVMRAACRGSHAAFPLHAVRGFDAQRDLGYDVALRPRGAPVQAAVAADSPVNGST